MLNDEQKERYNAKRRETRQKMPEAMKEAIRLKNRRNTWGEALLEDWDKTTTALRGKIEWVKTQEELEGEG